MRLLMCSLLLPLVTSLDAPPISKGLQPEDHDLLVAESSTRETVRARALGTLQNEVSDLPAISGKTLNDDYSDFADEPVRNGGANHQLKEVDYVPIAKKYDIPKPEREDSDDDDDDDTSSKHNGRGPHGRFRGPVIIGALQPNSYQLLRKGYYYQHYPYQMLSRQYLLRPRYAYAYPPQYQNAVYTYHHRLPYKDPYNIYRSDPTFNPYAAAYGGGCGGGSSGGGSSSGCRDCGAGGGGGGVGGVGGVDGVGGAGGAAGCGGGAGCGSGYGGYGGSGCGGEGGEGYGDEDGSYEEESEGGRSGETRINKKDPLEDLDLEDLEKLGGDSVERTEKDRPVRKLRQVLLQ